MQTLIGLEENDAFFKLLITHCTPDISQRVLPGLLLLLESQISRSVLDIIYKKNLK
jgi:hypothetical protein